MPNGCDLRNLQVTAKLSILQHHSEAASCTKVELSYVIQRAQIIPAVHVAFREGLVRLVTCSLTFLQDRWIAFRACQTIEYFFHAK